MVKALLFDPRIFNYVIMALYVLNAVRWSIHRSWADAAYWISAWAITATVTWGYKH
jgi:hypothetical protein